MPVRVTTAFKRLLCLDGVNVTAVDFTAAAVTVTVAVVVPNPWGGGRGGPVRLTRREPDLWLR